MSRLKIVWIPPDVGYTLTYATFPKEADDEAQRKILKTCTDAIRRQHGEAAAATVRITA